ncbi:hypothetical protein M885DRAFT_517806 [Pelagophyceae sp. CCMP2097]|nr:hypothetical protein M885DRAFT_517806 [Pelagophyceae sp. CCMP2097]|mmetsp:Transcript_18586/g.62728  ORF Transcript_18586/g.62728 Transcript_18586/m.62728 type:complete len:261 (-) Transcript_18586:243-1025(-)
MLDAAASEFAEGRCEVRCSRAEPRDARIAEPRHDAPRADAPRHDGLSSATGPHWWRRLKRVEAKVSIAVLQRFISYDAVEPVVKLTKLLTRRSAYATYAAALLGACSAQRCAELAIAYLLSRKLNGRLKRWASQPRPYVEYPADVLHYKKRKSSNSFPSQSIQTLCITLCAFMDCRAGGLADVWAATVGVWYLSMLIATVAIIRIFRGLHYPHDILASMTIARGLYTIVHGAARHLAVPSMLRLDALLVGAAAASASRAA